MRDHEAGGFQSPRTGTGQPIARMLVALGVAAILLGACQRESGDDDAGLAHIHGLGINPADGRLYAASHHGVFVVTGDAAPQQVAGRSQDFMGFTVVGPDHFLGSGHPALDDKEQPPHLGLIESTDAAQSWTTLSMSGEADFHALEAKHGRVYGYDSQSSQLMISEDMRTWDRRGRIAVEDIAVSPDDPQTILATGLPGLTESSDGGRTFTALRTAPELALIDWPSPDLLTGVDANGLVHISHDGGRTWLQRGAVPGAPQAVVVHSESEMYVATGDAIYRSTDQAQTFTVFQKP